jgi:hypothetical protein
VIKSEIAHAVSGSPFGIFEYHDVALPPRGKEHWDGMVTHNPTIQRFGSKYCLYYMGNVGDDIVTPGLNMGHPNNQRIGVAVADSPLWSLETIRQACDRCERQSFRTGFPLYSQSNPRARRRWSLLHALQDSRETETIALRWCCRSPDRHLQVAYRSFQERTQSPPSRTWRDLPVRGSFHVVRRGASTFLLHHEGSWL